ncbi:MAG: spermidine synthase, partial [Planctomycetota bacterium]
SFSAGFLLVPALGIQNTLLLGIAVNGGMGVVALWHAGAHASEARAIRLRIGAAVVAVFCLFALLGAPQWNAMLMARGLYKYALDPALKEGNREAIRARFLRDRNLVFYREGITTTVCVVDEGDGHIYLATNGKVDASTIQDMPTQVLLAQIPMAVAPNNQEVMVIGFASGTTVGSALLHSIKSLVAVEIEPAIIEASRFFNHVNNRPLQNPSLVLVHEDARNYLTVTERRFDLIISEPSNPWMTIASNLFTREFYETARARLNPGGCYCQWLQLYALRPQDMKCIAATFRTVFPHTFVFFSKESVDLMLVGSADPFQIDVENAANRMVPGIIIDDLDRVGVYGVESLLAHLLIGPAELAEFCRDAPINTDDNARIEFATPRTIALNEGSRIQDELLKYSRGISAYLKNYGNTPAERADFLIYVANATMEYGDGVRDLTKALARDAIEMDPGNETVKTIADALLQD